MEKGSKDYIKIKEIFRNYNVVKSKIFYFQKFQGKIWKCIQNFKFCKKNKVL